MNSPGVLSPIKYEPSGEVGVVSEGEDGEDSAGSSGTPIIQLLRRNVKRFRGGLVFKAHRLLCHSTLGLRVIKKKKKYTHASVTLLA